ncbi:MAG: phosphatidate cytidylyltransferase [Candidatus Eisenbacteria bacterium]|nr:phosphatidate cytidylyltransferase [Candidatus Eisenbacteria bacterium]
MKSLTPELGRKAIHLGAIILPVGYYILPEARGRQILVILTLISLTIDVIRLNEPRIRTFFYYFFGRLVRDHERYNLLGSTYLLLACLIAVYTFEKPIAVAALCFLIVGDTMAALVGRTFGRIPIFNKTLEGSLACFASCIVIGLIVPGLTWTMILAGSLVATLFELLPIPLDDNLRIPLSAGFTMMLLG